MHKVMGSVSDSSDESEKVTKVKKESSQSSDESEKVTKVKKESSQSSQEEPCKISKNKPKEISKKKVVPKKSSPTSATQKSKQSSLMSFFQKK
jgi:hypothetical protein